MHEKFSSMKLGSLFAAILSLETEDECYAFFDDLCTVQELKAISQRLEVARMLAAGRVFNDIAAQTGASTATISRVNRALNYGSGGYRLVFGKQGK